MLQLCHLNSAADKLEATLKKKQVKEILTRKNVFDDYLLCADLLYKHERLASTQQSVNTRGITETNLSIISILFSSIH